MDSNNSSGNVGTSGTIGTLKTDFANLLINRVTLGECLNVIRDACVARASEMVDQADDSQLENIKQDVAQFTAASSGNVGSSGESGESGNVSSGGNVGTTESVSTDYYSATTDSDGNVGSGGNVGNV